MQIEVIVEVNRFPYFANAFPAQLDEITRRGVLKVIEFADPMTPVLTGDLKSKKEIGPDYVVWLMPYASYVNFGTIYMEAQPFASVAAEMAFPYWLADIRTIEDRL